MRFDLLHPREQLVQIMGRIYRYGLTTTSGGNLSVLDENGDLWITPSAVDKGALQQRDIMCLLADGRTSGVHTPSSEYPFHQSIYRRRTDIRAIVHAHSPALVSFSIARKIPDTRIIPQAHHVCGPVGYAPYALPGSQQLGENIAATFAQGFDVVLLENHGVVTAGPDLLTAFQRLETLDFCARTQIQAHSLGPVHTLSDGQIARFERSAPALPSFQAASHSSHERALRAQICHMVRRAYDQRLMTSTEGTVSARVDEGRFLITPYGIDRSHLEVEDIVLIEGGRAEAGKQPSRATRLHHVIYDQHPGVHCIITAQSPNAMAYAVTGKALDSKTIPESYVVLRNVPLVPHGLQYEAPEGISAAITKNSPVVLIENDTVLATGASVHQAFDRLEVADFTAFSLLSTLSIGPLVPIGEDDVRELEAKFG
ncbi:MAG: class II aldolase/adducin family protein [Anaerolineae bacterium]|nr:class II aldolase/adducin family protein [Anaerolineae bacterium]